MCGAARATNASGPATATPPAVRIEAVTRAVTLTGPTLAPWPIAAASPSRIASRPRPITAVATAPAARTRAAVAAWLQSRPPRSPVIQKTARVASTMSLRVSR